MNSDAIHSNSDIQDRLQAIYALHIKNMDFRLGEGPYGNLLQALGNPHHHLPPTIHIAGTNGKGSTLAFMKALYEAQGTRVHAYTSPHLIRFNERILLQGLEITDDQLLHYLDMVDQTNDGAPVTFFEYTTALAFKAFTDQQADICLLETGLGGRLDCTNVIENPAATVITAIGYDHMDWLGYDIEQIAAEKAGIMKPGVPCFIAPQRYDIAHVFEHRAAEIGCELHFVERRNDLPVLGLVGDHQKDNASTAFTVFEFLNGGGSNDNHLKALTNVRWPARMENISTTPDLWFDCGHNLDGARAIAQQLKAWKTEDPTRPIHMILGLAADKNPDDFMSPLWPYIDYLYCIDLPNARNPQSAQDLAERVSAPANTIHPQCFNTLQQVIDDINGKDPMARIFVTGSLYLYEQTKNLVP